jgi:hypothetical protein
VSAAHRVARRVLSVALAGSRSPWGAAAVSELEHVTGTWAVLRWTVGGLRVAWRAHHCTPVTVPAGMLYVLGDNREVARDSRHYGPVPEAGVSGRVVL